MFSKCVQVLPILPYGLRCTKLLQKAIELINENHEAAIIPGMVQGAMSSAVECFLIGLSYEISIRMTGQHPNILEFVINAAIDIERLVSQRKDTNRRDDPRSDSESSNLQSDQT